MAILTIALALALQDAGQAHEEPKPRAGPPARRINTPAVSSNEPQRRPVPGAAPSRARPAVVNAPPGDRPTGKPGASDLPVNGPPRGYRPRRRPAPVAPPAAVPMTAPAPTPPPVRISPPAPPAPPPVPRPSQVGDKPPTPRGSPQSWITREDMPAQLFRDHVTGTAGFAVEIDSLGRVTACRITRSSGAPGLDTLTCMLIRRRARFNPGTDRAGTPIPGSWSSELRWDLPDVRTPFGSWARVVRYVVNPDGGLKSCVVTNYGMAPMPDRDPCLPDRAWLSQLRGPGTLPVTIDYAEINSIDGANPPGFAALKGTTLYSRRIGFSIGADGQVVGCKVAGQGELDLRRDRYLAYDCHPGLRYVMPTGRSGAGATYTIQIVSDGSGAHLRPQGVVTIPSTYTPPIAVLAPPAPPPPPPSSGAWRPPVPLGSPASWITDDDYPAAALRAGTTGTVVFQLNIGTTGTPTQCIVTSTSGSELLDNTTCMLMMRRARFRPALGADGRPREEFWSSRMRWELPREAPPAAVTVQPVSWSRVLSFSISPSGKLSGCDDKYFGRPGVADPGVCDRLAALPPERLKALRGSSSGPVDFQVRYQHSVMGQPGVRPHAPPRGYRTVVSQQVTFNINAAGLVGGCRGDLPRLGLPMLAPDCDYTARYGRQGGRLIVTVTQTVLSTGDIRVLPALRALTGE